MGIIEISDKVQIEPKSSTRRHHHHNHHHHHHHRRVCHHKRRSSSSSSTTKTKSLSFIASIRKSILKCHRCLIKFFSKLATRRHRHGFVILEKNDHTLFEADFGPGTPKLDFNSGPGKPKFDFMTGSSLQPQVLKSGNHRHQLLPPLVPGKKRTIVLDLDETLVHSIPHPPPPNYDFTIQPSIDGVTIKFYVLKRPWVDEFLESISKKYEVVVFTAGLEPYASMLLDILDPKGLISHRLYRDSCKPLVTGKYVKDLSRIGRDLGKVVIVDDNPKSYSLQRANAIPIKRFEDDAEDRELKKLMRFFKSYCGGYEDMRDAVKEYFGGATMNKPRRLLDPSLTTSNF
ncbi:hypothetical protein PTKIN_Ptkin18bG0105200 [Pterospermum kingtungense]